jgi:GTPase
MAKEIPLIALVGRPNVGKSTLFNRLVGRRQALVHDSPGVTRDRLFGEVVWDHKCMRIVDTGGLETGTVDPMLKHIRAQTQLAIDEADLVLLVVDGAAGLSPLDRDVAQQLRTAGKKTFIIVTKLDVPAHDMRLHEFHELGFDHVLGVSGEHGRGTSELLEALIAKLDPPEKYVQPPVEVEANDDETDPEPVQIMWKKGPIHLAVVGRPNAGKSSIINSLLGEERHLATPIAGTTRDPIDSKLTYNDYEYVLIDTAGVRKKRSIAEQLEQFAVVAAFKSMDRADVVLIVLDAQTGISEQDIKIAAMAHDKGKGLIFLANKWDLVSGEHGKAYEEDLRSKTQFVSYAPLLKVSAKTGRNVESILTQALSVQIERHKRVRTGELNRFFRDVVERHPAPVQNGKKPKLFFVSQPLVRPPTFIFSASRAKDVHFSYERFLKNVLRERYGFAGTPLWIKFRERSKQQEE